MNPLKTAAVLLLILAGTSGIRAVASQLSADQAKVLESATALALAYTQALPNFICTQITHRNASPQNTGVAVHNNPSSVGNVRGGATGIDAAPVPSGAAYSNDVIEERLTFFEQKENYEVIKINRRRVPGMRHLDNQGAITAGEFGSALHDIFDPQSHTVFTWERMDRLRGRQVYVFAFHVPKESGALVIYSNPGQQIVVSYAGRIFVDADTREVIRITSRLDLPPKFPIQTAEREVDYSQTTIAGKSYNLPSHSEVRMKVSLYSYVNKIDFKNYQKFTVESKMLHEISPQQ